MSILRHILAAIAILAWLLPAVFAEENRPSPARQAEANGVINSAIPGRVNLTHEAIPILGWPPMQMDFNMVSTIDATILRPGLRVRFTVKEISPSQYQIISIVPQK